MKPRNVLFTLFFILLLGAIFVFRKRSEPGRGELFDRTPNRLELTRHAKCRMDCREISMDDIEEVMEKGVINLGKSDKADRPCPTYALQGTTRDGEYLRVVFAQCGDETRVVTCYNLKKDFECHCPGDDRPKEKKSGGRNYY
jgi:hypothetical protein